MKNFLLSIFFLVFGVSQARSAEMDVYYFFKALMVNQLVDYNDNNLATCRNAWEFGIVDEDWRSDLVNLAIFVVNAERGMKRYPQFVWKPTLQWYEGSIISNKSISAKAKYKVAGEVQQKLIELADDYRRSTSKKLPEIISEADCGAGETEIKIRLGNNVRAMEYIHEFYFLTCDNPRISMACQWQTYSGGSLYLSGRYAFRISHYNGSISTVLISLDDIPTEKNEKTYDNWKSVGFD